jgi:hypothetical protein
LRKKGLGDYLFPEKLVETFHKEILNIRGVELGIKNKKLKKSRAFLK